MIYVVEIPHQQKPVAWAAVDKDDAVEFISRRAANSGEIIYERSTVREMLEDFGYDSVAEMLADDDPQVPEYIPTLAEKYGLDTVLYMGWSRDEWSPEPLDEFDEYIAWNGHDLNAQLVFLSDDEARQALLDDTLWSGRHNGQEARAALQQSVEEMAA